MNSCGCFYNTANGAGATVITTGANGNFFLGGNNANGCDLFLLFAHFDGV